MSSSEDEDVKKFADAVDKSLFSNNFYKDDMEKEPEEKKVEIKSNRYLTEEENVFKSEINIPESQKNFIYSKMSEIISSQIKYVDHKESNVNAEEDPEDCVKLLRGAKTFIKHKTDEETTEPKRKLKIKRRQVEDDILSESDKIASSAIEIDKINHEVSLWSEKRRHEPLEYVHKKGVLYLREPPNEFTKKRKQNNWDESKIKNESYAGKSLCKIK
jgi:hypothetical protein